ncbi:hypothetical protein NL676_031095 [Syzygium grande]|nr:hypothetical protein NL676_031095 [Syzygium grande]
MASPRKAVCLIAYHHRSQTSDAMSRQPYGVPNSPGLKFRNLRVIPLRSFCQTARAAPQSEALSSRKMMVAE